MAGGNFNCMLTSNLRFSGVFLSVNIINVIPYSKYGIMYSFCLNLEVQLLVYYIMLLTVSILKSVVIPAF